MSPDQVLTITHFLLATTRQEATITAKVIAAVPDDKSDYRSDPKARTARELAWHIAYTDVWFLESIVAGEFQMTGEPVPPEVKTIADMAAWYEKNMAATADRVAALPPEKLAQPVNFLGAFNFPAGFYLGFLNNHMIHHRGQLSCYLRPMGSKVPSIYGGSADEPMDM